MKHSWPITLFLLGLFIVTQVIGLAITNNYIDHTKTAATGNVTFKALPYSIERPQIEEKVSWIYIVSAVIVGTLLVLLLVKFQKVNIWRIWFALAVGICLTIAFRAFIPDIIALILAILLTWWKVFKPNVYIHNFTELFIYGGLAAIFVPIMNVLSIVILLLIISVYDFFAVFKSKHMVKMAKFQSKTKMFAGLLIPYKMPKISFKKQKEVPTRKVAVRTAVLGGGDMGFPLLFAGVVMKGLMLTNPVWLGFLKAMIIPVFAAVGLFWLLMLAQKDKFYPAMPFITGGCLVGYGVLFLINLI